MLCSVVSGSDVNFQDEDGNTCLHHIDPTQEIYIDVRLTPELHLVSIATQLYLILNEYELYVI